MTFRVMVFVIFVAFCESPRVSSLWHESTVARVSDLRPVRSCLPDGSKQPAQAGKLHRCQPQALGPGCSHRPEPFVALWPNDTVSQTIFSDSHGLFSPYGSYVSSIRQPESVVIVKAKEEADIRQSQSGPALRAGPLGSSETSGNSRAMLRGFLLFVAMTACSRAAEGVILLHGLGRTNRSMERMEAAFATAGYSVVNVDYPSRVSAIAPLGETVIARALADTRLRGCSRVHFVAHSLGCILVRSYFARRSEPRLGRVVMLGPPNQGSEVVDRLGSSWLFRRINGPAGSELGTGADSVPNSLEPVRFELGVIAGDRSINWINSLMIAGRDDGKVSVARTKVAGMKEHIVAHVSHPFLMKDRAVIAAAMRFVESGSFSPESPTGRPSRFGPASRHLFHLSRRRPSWRSRVVTMQSKVEPRHGGNPNALFAGENPTARWGSDFAKAATDRQRAPPFGLRCSWVET